MSEPRETLSDKPRRRWLGRVVLLAVIVGSFVAFYFLGGKEYVSLSYLKSKRTDFQAYYDDNALLVLAVFFGIYVGITGLNIPLASPISLVAGFLFGRWLGTVVVSFASTLGATLGFLASRYILREFVQRHLGKRLEKINRGIEREGAFYLFTLRLIAAIPFWLINIGMGLTPIKVRTYWWVSQLGMLPGTFVYVNAGTELGKIDPEAGLAGIVTPELIMAFLLLGIFPLLIKWLFKLFRRKPVEAPSDPASR